jgi:hypothetical protein
MRTSARNAAASFSESARLKSGATAGVAQRALESMERIAMLAGAAVGDELITVARRPAR